LMAKISSQMKTEDQSASARACDGMAVRVTKL
jgi:hypothetical protein